MVLKDGELATEVSDKFRNEEVKHYFPAFSTTSITTADVLPIVSADQVVVRVIRLLNPDLCVFPPGYFSFLFVEIVGKYSDCQLIRLFRDGLVLRLGDGNFQIVLRGTPAGTSFTIEVEARGSAHPPGSAWVAMQEIRTLVLDTPSWRRNVAVQEFGLHPNARVSCGIAIKEMEETLRQGGVLGAQVHPFYYGLHDNDSFHILHKQAVELLHKHLETMEHGLQQRIATNHEEVVGKLDKIVPMLEKLREVSAEGLHALCVKVEDAVQQAQGMQVRCKSDLHAMMALLTQLSATKNSPRNDVDAGEGVEEWAAVVQEFLKQHRAEVEAANLSQSADLQKMKEDIVSEFSRLSEGVIQTTLMKLEEMEEAHELRLQEQLDQSRDEIIANLSAQITKMQSQMQQHGAAGDDAVDMLGQMLQLQTTLEAVRNMQDNTGHGLYDVPLIVEIDVEDRKATLTSAVKHAMYEVYRMHFRCPLCGQQAACGPKGNGYKLLVTKGWVKKVSKVLAGSLVALKVISLVTPLPLPYVDMLAQYLPTEDVANVADALECGVQYVEDLEERGTASVGKVRQVVQHQLGAHATLLEVTQEYVSQVRSLLLMAKETSPPQNTGLSLAICATTKQCAWVCGGDCKGRYMAEGNACLGIKVSLA